MDSTKRVADFVAATAAVLIALSFPMPGVAQSSMSGGVESAPGISSDIAGHEVPSQKKRERPPSVPTDLRSTSHTASSVTLAWNASRPGSLPIAGYRIFEDGKLIGSSAETQYVASGLKANTRYFFRVAAYDEAGHLSARSRRVKVTTDKASADMAGHFVPYVDVTLYPTFDLTAEAPQTGGFYTLAFIVDGGGCTAEWGGVIPLSTPGFLTDDIASLRATGGDVSVSFGGENGSELAETCSTVEELEAQYEAVIEQYQLRRIDFDIEGAAVADQTSIAMRDEAIAALQKQHPGLEVTFTLPVLPTGLTQDGLNVVADAINKGVVLSAVNVMAMDYGGPDSQMGADAIKAIQATAAQLGSLYPKASQAQLISMVGVTPMIGVNDTPGETFTLNDAQQLLTFASANKIALMSMWSAGRDQECPGGAEPYAQDNCSGIVQNPFEFSGIFKLFNP
jgi:hypothetical protein